MYVPKPDSPLWYEIAKNHSDLINRCGFDGVYFDAIEGIQYMWGEENYWYYGGKFVMDVAKDLNRPVGMEFAGMIHQWWHYRSRYQAWDYPVRGYKRFLDVHLGSMKAGEEYQHGCWLGHDPKIDKFAGLKEGGLYLPFQLGWWNLSTWKDPSTEPTYGDDVDYIGCKMVGNNAGFSFSHPVDIKRLTPIRFWPVVFLGFTITKRHAVPILTSRFWQNSGNRNVSTDYTTMPTVRLGFAKCFTRGTKSSMFPMTVRRGMLKTSLLPNLFRCV